MFHVSTQPVIMRKGLTGVPMTWPQAVIFMLGVGAVGIAMVAVLEISQRRRGIR